MKLAGASGKLYEQHHVLCAGTISGRIPDFRVDRDRLLVSFASISPYCPDEAVNVDGLSRGSGCLGPVPIRTPVFCS